VPTQILLGLLLMAAGLVAAPRPATAQFAPIETDIEAVAGGAAAWADVDDDGDLDLLLLGNRTGDTDSPQPSATLYENQNGTFTPMNAGLTGVSAGDAAFGDFDDDGDPDLIITGNVGGFSFTDPPVGSATLYENDGDGAFSAVDASIAGVTVGSVDWGNVDSDDDLELVVTGNVGGIGIFPFPDVEPSARIYDHQGGGSFSAIGAGLSGVSVGSSRFGDIDGDDDLDLVITGGQGSDLDDPQPLTTLYENDGTASFSALDAGLPDLAGGTSRWFDAEGDGDLDLILTGQTADETSLTQWFRNNGSGSFTAVDDGLIDVAAGVSTPRDVDGDDDVDLLVSGRTSDGPGTVLYENDGNASFTPVAAGLPALEGTAAAWGDVFGDDDPDLVLAGRDASETAQAHVFENQTPTSNCPLAWSLALTGTDAADSTQTLTLGRSASATPGLDPACNETELPPPSDFDLRFTGADLPGVDLGAGTHTDLRPVPAPPNRMPSLPPPPEQTTGPPTASTSADTTTWRIALQGLTRPLSLTWDPSVLQDSLPGATVQLVDVATGGTRVSVDMTTTDSTAVTDPAVAALAVQLAPTLQRTVPIAEGWNLLSVPLDAPDPSFGALFPTCTSGFLFDDGYTSLAPDASIPLGRGGFYNCAPASPTISGTAPSTTEISVSADWNLIGPLADTVATSTITSDPSGLIQSSFFGFETSGGYTPTDTLRPGRGYWVKTSGSGVLDLGGGSPSGAPSPAPARAAPTTKPPVALVVSDAAGHRAAVRWQSAGSSPSMHRSALPPRPPASAVDVRFATGRATAPLSPASSTTRTIDLQGLTPPLRLTLNASHTDVSLRLRPASGDGPIHLTPAQPTSVLRSPTQRIRVQLQAAPTAVHLAPTRPNPATTRATLSYALPTAASVSLQVYDVLGRRVARLVDRRQRAGRHRATLNAARLPSGVYFVRLHADGVTHTRRLTVVR
jgi:hypothetical protein